MGRRLPRYRTSGHSACDSPLLLLPADPALDPAKTNAGAAVQGHPTDAVSRTGVATTRGGEKPTWCLGEIQQGPTHWRATLCGEDEAAEDLLGAVGWQRLGASELLHRSTGRVIGPTAAGVGTEAETLCVDVRTPFGP